MVLVVPASPLTCQSGYSCTSIYIGWACCDEIQCAGDYRACADYGDNMCPGLDASECSNIYTSILSWSVRERNALIGGFADPYSTVLLQIPPAFPTPDLGPWMMRPPNIPWDAVNPVTIYLYS